MRLSGLIAPRDNASASTAALELLRGGDTEILGVATDSRHVQPGYLFIAVPGTQKDGRAFIPNALSRGAVAVLAPAGQNNDLPLPADFPLLLAHDMRSATAYVAAAFYPRQPEIIVAVTGTSGKTSTVQFAREIWGALGQSSASLGTIGLVTAKGSHYGSLTTPDSLTLHKTLDSCVREGVTRLAMEASSHGIELKRLDCVKIKAAGFTNFSRDHLDYHTTMEAYFSAKLRLFEELLEPHGTAVLNADIPEFDALCRVADARKVNVISYGKNAQDLKVLEIVPDSKGQVLRLSVFGRERRALFPVMGQFQAWNALCALGLVLGGDAPGSSRDDADIIAALERVTPVPGRLQHIGHTPSGGSVFIDYAHKPNALENVLVALRPHVDAKAGGRLVAVFGCGGNRDKGKRPLMGGIAQSLADMVIVTDDNPRHEDPDTIRREILEGCHTIGAPAPVEIGDRAEAIRMAVTGLQRGDVLVIAGKGHESGQIIGDKTIPFDDALVARGVLSTLT
ncbi:MAG: UDP-N-acetylmuramoyl-L-alanyl-D-glutamate--2,6-diaminopimelate ligase [Bdellovibrionales bacterium]